jgi:hypothetical protein
VLETTQRALGDIRRIRALDKRPMKAVIARAVLPASFEPLAPAARDLQAAAHIRVLEFGAVDDIQLDFEESAET